MKKAQGALEFLMTYGWAFLVILIMIGALAYFGVLNPTKFLPDRCQFGSQILCKQYIVKNCDGTAVVASGCNADDPTMSLQVTNNFGKNVYLCGATLQTDVSGIGQTATAPLAAAPGAGNFMVAFDANADNLLTGAEATANADALETTCATVDTNDDVDNLWREGETKTILVKTAGAGSMVKSDKNKFTLCFKYFDANSNAGYSKDVCGEIYSSVQ
jgi:hypothetical protein